MQKGFFTRASKLLTIALVAAGFNSYGQDIVKVRNQNYTSYFSKSEHIPVLVVYSLTPDMFNCIRVKGENNMMLTTDPQLADATDLRQDYNNSLFDNAQLMAPEENTCDRDAYAESFYFTNVMPMPGHLHKPLWEDLHAKEIAKAKKYKKVKVFAGTVGRNWVIGKEQNIVVPEWCWKVIYIPSTDEYICYEFHNIEPFNGKDKLAMHKVDVNAIESLAGVHFVNGVISAPYVMPTASTN